MFHSLVLPFQISIFVLPFLGTAGYFLLRRIKATPTTAAIGSSVCSAIGFVPLCVTVMLVLNQFRYGEFHFARGADVRLAHVWVPSEATDVIVHARDNGYNARFRIDSAGLEAWLDFLGAPKEFNTSRQRREDWSRSDGTSSFPHHFEKYGWATPRGVIEYVSASAPNGAGFTIFDDPNSTDVYVYHGYW